MSELGDMLRTVDTTVTIEPNRPVFYFDLEPVLERCPTRMGQPERLKVLCKSCVKRVAPAELVLFKVSGFFLVVQSCDDASAPAVADTINVALINLFFGTDSLSAQRMPPIFRRVAVADMEQAGPAPFMDQGRIVDLPGPSRAAPTRPDLDKIQSDPLRRLAEGGVPGYDGLRLGFLPMYNLQRGVASIFFCGPVRAQAEGWTFGTSVLADVAVRDRPSIDEAMLEHSLRYARQILPTRVPAAIGTSVSFETLAWSRGRQLYQHALRTANVAENPFLIVKIDDVPRGTPAARLAEIVSIVRPFIKRVFVQLPEGELGPMQNGNIGVAGYCATLPPRASASSIVRLASALTRTAGAQHALSCLDGLAHPATLDMVRAAGIRFAGGSINGHDEPLAAPPVDGTEVVLRVPQKLACA